MCGWLSLDFVTWCVSGAVADGAMSLSRERMDELNCSSTVKEARCDCLRWCCRDVRYLRSLW